jgi:hypothetical protein
MYLIFSCCLCLGLQSDLFVFRFWTKFFNAFVIPPHAHEISHPSHLPWFVSACNIWRCVQVMKLIVQRCQPSCDVQYHRS